MKALILLGGEAPDPLWLRQQAAEADWIVGADSGALLALEGGFALHALVGDMDSLPREALLRLGEGGLPIERHSPIKDETDGLLALERALERGARRIVFAGAFGGRPDHLMANAQLLAYARRRGVEAVMADGRQSLWAADGHFQLTGKPGDIVSLLPLGQARVAESRGLAYPLDHLLLPLDVPLGVSNEMTANTAHIRVEQGMVVVYHRKL